MAENKEMFLQKLREGNGEWGVGKAELGVSDTVRGNGENVAIVFAEKLIFDEYSEFV